MHVFTIFNETFRLPRITSDNEGSILNFHLTLAVFSFVGVGDYNFPQNCLRGWGGYLFDLAGNSTTGGAWKKGMIQTNLSRILLID